METCRHFRNQIPSEDADELRAADPEPCEVCDRLRSRARYRVEDWDPKPVRYPRTQVGEGCRTRPGRRRVGWQDFSRLLLTPVHVPFLSRKPSAERTDTFSA